MDRFEKVLFNALTEVMEKVWSDQIESDNAAKIDANVVEIIAN